MSPDENDEIEPRGSRGGLQIMLAILVAMTLFAIYANVQNLREPRIESVIDQPLPTPTPSPAPTPTPSPAA